MTRRARRRFVYDNPTSNLQNRGPHRARHAGWFIETKPDYSFSGEVNSVPLMAVEFPQASTEYAIVFAGAAINLAAVILGVRHDENLFWPRCTVGRQIHPGLRAPLSVCLLRSGDRFLLCVDEEFPGINQDGRGQPLFVEDGKPSPYLDNVLKFLQEYQAQFLRTQAFCARIKELDLLEPMQAQVTLEGGRRLSLGGFMAINKEKLKALPGGKLAEMAKTDELELIYLHIQSMRNFEHLRDRLAIAETPVPTTSEPAVPELAVAETDGASVH